MELRLSKKIKKTYHVNSGINCQGCGQFIKYDDIATGKARHCMKSPDSHFSSESYESLCRKCFIKDKEMQK